MKMKNLGCLVVSLFAFYISGFSQAALPSFQGSIIDKNNGEILPFATIQVLSLQGFGTVSDSEGNFLFVGKSDWPDTVEVLISYLGYESLKATIVSGQRSVLYLNPSVKELREILVYPSEELYEIMEEIIAAIPQNYPNRHERVYAVTTEKTFQDRERRTPFYTARANVQADNFSYAHRFNPVNIEILNKEVEVFPAYYEQLVRIQVVAGVHNLERFDLIAKRAGPFDAKLLRDYDLELGDTLQFDGQPFALMKFSIPDKLEGRIFYSIQDLGVKKVDVEIRDFSTALYRSINRDDNDGSREFFGISTEYLKYEDGKYRFQYAYYNTYFKYTRTGLYLENIFTLEEFEEGTKGIPFTRQANFNDPLVNYTEVMAAKADSVSKPENASFMLPGDSVILSQLPLAPTALNLISILSRLHSRISLGVLHQNWSSAAVAVNDPFMFSQEIHEGQRLAPFIGYELLYPLGNRLKAWYGFQGSLQRQRYHRYELGIESTHSLSKKGGLGLKIGLATGRQRMGLRLENAIFSPDTEISNETFNTGEALLFSRERDWVLTPHVGFTFRLHEGRFLHLRGYWPLSLGSDQGFYIMETNEKFLKQKARTYMKQEDGLRPESRRLMQSFPIISLTLSGRR
jgi:hypothetical protein